MTLNGSGTMPEIINQTNIVLPRKSRVKFLKRFILTVLFLAILVPIIICIMLMVRMNRLESEVTDLRNQLQTRTENNTLEESNLTEMEQSAYQETVMAETAAAKQLDNQSQVVTTVSENGTITERKVYLTFDDGPSIYTDEILDILANYNVKATFFVVGKEDQALLPMYKRIVEEGHTLAMHSYSHKYEEIYASAESFVTDFRKLQDFLYENTGVRTVFYRFPGGSSNTVSSVPVEELLSSLSENQITYFDWNISSKDASTSFVGAREIANNVLANLESYSTPMILFHDAADKRTTVEALPIIIEQIQKMDNTVLLPITEETKPVQHIRNE